MGKGVIDIGPAKPYFTAFVFIVSLFFICSRPYKWLPLGRAGFALIGSTLMVFFGIVPPNEIGAVVNWDTIILLMSMMMLCNYMEKANIWDSASRILMYKCNSPTTLMVRVCMICAVMSSILTNDTVCVTITPIIIAACKSSNLPLFPFLMAIATSSNIGSASLPVGNPQNMIIATASGVEFVSFFKASVVSSIIGCVLNTTMLYFYFKSQLSDYKIIISSTTTTINTTEENNINNNNNSNIEYVNENTREMNLLRSSKSKIKKNHRLLQQDEMVDQEVDLQELHEEEVEETSPELSSNNIILNGSNYIDIDLHQQQLVENNGSIINRYQENPYVAKSIEMLKLVYFYRAGVMALLILIGFFVGLHMGFTVLFGVSILMFLERKDIRDIIDSIDWELLIFFSGLFVLVDGFDREFSTYAWKFLEPWVPLQSNQAVKIIIFTILVLVSCNILGNVPLVLALCPRFLAESAPNFTWLILAYVSTVAGNFTLIGSVANLIVAEKAKQDYQMGFVEYLKFGAPSTIVVICAGIYPIVLLTQ